LVFPGGINLGSSSVIDTSIASGTGGAVYINSAQASSFGSFNLSGGQLLITTAAPSTTLSTTNQSTASSFTLSPATVATGKIITSGTGGQSFTTLPATWNVSTPTTLTPALIPGGGFSFTSNTSTITLNNDSTF